MGLDYYGSMTSILRVLAGTVLLATIPLAWAQTPVRPAASAPAPAATGEDAATPPARSRMGARLMYELLLGELNFREGEPQAGTAFMLDAARRTGDESLFRRATEMAIQSRSGPAALETTRAWRQAHPQSVDATRFELQVLVVLGRVAETEPLLRDMLRLLPAGERVDFITAIPTLYQRVPDRAEAVRTVEAALHGAFAVPALAPAAWTTVGRMRLQAGDKNGALSAATLAQAADARSEWPALLALQLLVNADMPSAEALVQRYLESPQAKPEVRVAYARALVEQGRPADANAQLDVLTRQQPDYAEGWLVKGALLLDERRGAEAEQALQRYLRMTDQASADHAGGRDQARMMLAQLAERRNDFTTADQLLRAVESPEQALSVQVRRAQLLVRQGRMNEARQAIRSVPERQPEDARNKLLAEAQLLRDNQLGELSYKMLSDELANDPDDATLLYDTAMAAEKAGRLDDMERLLRRLIELDPKAANAYNALGYSLADRGVRLQEAKTLIEKAVQLRPDDHYIQDSLGWVEFRLGNLPQARQLLEGAFNKRPDPEIAAHLGEVLWAIGDREAALSTWREGMRLDPDNDTMVKTLKRLQVSL